MMPKYSIVVILYILVQLLSIVLISILIYSLLKSEPHFTKWTLFQLFISAFGNGFSALPPIIIYGDELIKHAFKNKDPICIISNKIYTFTLYPMEFFPLVIAFYLWFALNKKIDIEKKCFWWVSIIIWSFTTAYNIFEAVMTSHEKNEGIIVTPFDCKRSKSSSNFYSYTISTISLATIAFIMTGHSSVILYKRWKNFKSNQNRSTAINLGRSVRLNTFCIIYITFLLVTSLPKIISHLKVDDNPDSPSLILSSYMGATPGILLFLIFGAKNQAALFLPFCYYVPPDKPTRCPDESIQLDTFVICD